MVKQKVNEPIFILKSIAILSLCTYNIYIYLHHLLPT